MVTCKPDRCTFGHAFSEQEMKLSEKRQVFNLPQPKLEVTEYQIYKGICPACGLSYKGLTRAGVNSHVQYGQLREDHPGMSSRMFYLKLKPKTMSRDLFEAFCFEHGFKVDVKTRSYRTTNSKGVNRFPNLLLEKDELGYTNQIWVSDITYFDLKDQVVFITFIQDLYNPEITGY